MKKNGAPHGELEGLILPEVRFSVMNSFNACSGLSSFFAVDE